MISVYMFNAYIIPLSGSYLIKSKMRIYSYASHQEVKGESKIVSNDIWTPVFHFTDDLGKE